MARDRLGCRGLLRISMHDRWDRDAWHWSHGEWKEPVRCANKSLLSIPPGDALPVFQRRQLLRLAVTRVSRTHCRLHCTVTICQLISLLRCVLSVGAMLLLQCSNPAICTFDSCSQFISVSSNLCTSAVAVYYRKRKSQESLAVWHNKEVFKCEWRFLLLPSAPWSKTPISGTFSLAHAGLNSTRPSADGETSVRFNMEILDHCQEVGLFDIILPLFFPRSRSVFAESTHPFICGDNRGPGFVGSLLGGSPGDEQINRENQNEKQLQWLVCRWMAEMERSLSALCASYGTGNRFKGWGGWCGGVGHRGGHLFSPCPPLVRLTFPPPANIPKSIALYCQGGN